MLAADPPAAVAASPDGAPAQVVVVSRERHSDVVASRDTPLALVKGRRSEAAVLRQVIFLTSTLTVVRPAAGSGEQTLRWTYEPYLQRQLCFNSMTGQFSCAAAEVEDLTEKAAGETPLAAAPAQAESDQASPGEAAPEPNPAAEAARIAAAAALRSRADAVFDDDRRLKIDPMLKAAGVSIRRPAVAKGSIRRPQPAPR